MGISYFRGFYKQSAGQSESDVGRSKAVPNMFLNRSDEKTFTTVYGDCALQAE